MMADPDQEQLAAVVAPNDEVARIPESRRLNRERGDRDTASVHYLQERPTVSLADAPRTVHVDDARACGAIATIAPNRRRQILSSAKPSGKAPARRYATARPM
jgi:hypothetical protein